MRWYLFLLATFFLAPTLVAAERLLVMEVYARIVPIGQTEPIPAPFVESVRREETPVNSEGIHALQGKSFQISSRFQDFAPVVVGLEGQRVSAQFTAVVLPNGDCAITRYEAFGLARTPKNQISPVGSSEVVSRNGFTVTPGHRVPQSVTAQSDDGTVIYYLIFSAAKGVAGKVFR
jgi:hypothetical protein